MDHSAQYYDNQNVLRVWIVLLVIKKIEDRSKYWHQFSWINDNNNLINKGYVRR